MRGWGTAAAGNAIAGRMPAIGVHFQYPKYQTNRSICFKKKNQTSSPSKLKGGNENLSLNFPTRCQATCGWWVSVFLFKLNLFSLV